MLPKLFLGCLVAVICSISAENLPNMPCNLTLSQRGYEAPGRDTVSLWEQSLSQQKRPKTIVLVQDGVWTTLLRTDVGNPMFDNSPFINSVRENFLKDYMFEELVDPSDERLNSRRGLEVDNFNGNRATFRRETYGIGGTRLTMNGVYLEDLPQELQDGTRVYVAEDFSFDSRQRIEEVVNEEAITGGKSKKCQDLPNIPCELTPALRGYEAPGREMINLWEQSMEQEDVPKTLLVYRNGVFGPVIRADAGNPLYETSPFGNSIRNNMLRDFMFDEALDANDPRLRQSAGVELTNYNGRKAIFKRVPSGETSSKLTVNGVDLDEPETLDDGTKVYTVNNFLYDHEKRTIQVGNDAHSVTQRFC